MHGQTTLKNNKIIQYRFYLAKETGPVTEIPFVLYVPQTMDNMQRNILNSKLEFQTFRESSCCYIVFFEGNCNKI
jgi:hypothetical protein